MMKRNFIFFFLVFWGSLTLNNSFSFAQESMADSPSDSQEQELPNSESENTFFPISQSEQNATSGVLTGGSEPPSGVLPYSSSIKINVDISSGSASTSFPINVAPGRAGIQPNLALFYNSGLKNGPLGMGWGLDLGTIEVSTKNGLPQYNQDDDVVLVQSGGAQELTWDETLQFYRARTEGVFMKIEKKAAKDERVYWLATDKKGTKYCFGQENSSRQSSADSARIFKWYLDEVKDSSGNTMTIQYIKDQNQVYPDKIFYTGNSQQGLDPYAQVQFEYETRPDINTSLIPGFEVRTAWRLKKINSLFEEDLQQSYHLNYSLSQATGRSLLKEISVHSARDTETLPATVFSYQNETNSSPVNYNFSSRNEPIDGGDELWNYQPNGDGPIYTQQSGHTETHQSWWSTTTYGSLSFGSGSRLANLFWTYLYVSSPKTIFVDFTSNGTIDIWVNNQQRSGEDRKSWPLKEGWNTVVISGQSENSFTFDLRTELTDGNNPNHVDQMDSRRQAFAPQLGGDFNGDGLSDIATFLRSEGRVEVQLGSLSGLGTSELWLGNFGAGHDVVPGDFNADGKTDVASFNRDSREWMVALSNGDGFNPPQPWGAYKPPAEQVGKNYIPNAGDFNADGKTDVFLFYKVSEPSPGSTEAVILLNTGQNSFSQTPWQPAVGEYAKSSFSGDFNGDGLPDFGNFDKTTGGWQFFLHPGRVGEPFTPCRPNAPCGSNAGSFGAGQQMIIADFNADGITDIGYYEKVSGEVSYRISQVTVDGSLNFGVLKQLPFKFSSNQDTIQIQSGDFNGDGVSDFIATNGIGLVETAFASNAKISDLLFESKNGIGATTELVYTSSCLNKDQHTFLPFCTPLVGSIVVTHDFNPTDRYETRYEYTKGKWDWQNREFLGFGEVKTLDPDGNYSMTLFRQDDFIYKGRPLQQTNFDASGNKYSEITNSWGRSVIRDQEIPIYFPRLDRTIQCTYEGQPTAKCTSTTYLYDGYGNLTETHEFGQVEIDGNGAVTDLVPEDNRHSETSYFNNEGAWLLGLPRQTLIWDYQYQLLRQSRFAYDTWDWDVLPTKGFLTKKEDFSFEEKNPLTQYEYDEYGNLKKTIDPLGHETIITYDSTYHVFAVSTLNALDQKVDNEYYGVDGVPLIDEEGLTGLRGQLKTTIDPNNQRVRKSYDEFGRVKKVISPLDSALLPTSEVEYNLNTLPIRVRTRARVESGQGPMIETIEFYDGLGRLIQAKSPAEDGLYVVSGQAEYNHRGLAERQYFPSLTTEPLDMITPIDPGRPCTQFEYDAMGRVVTTTNPDGTSRKVQYDTWEVYTTDENGHRQRSRFDAFGRLVSRVEYLGDAEPYVHYAETKYEYDITGNLIAVIDDHGNTTTITYDKLGRKKTMRDPDMGFWQYFYDLNGNLDYQIDAKGKRLDFDYDALNRLRNKHDEELMGVDYIYDDIDPLMMAQGRLRQASYGMGSLLTGEARGDARFEYDELGREKKSLKTIDGIEYKVERAYDALNRLKKIVYPQGEELYYSYNVAGQIKSVSETPVPNDDPPPGGQETIFLLHADEDFADTTARHRVSTHNASIDTTESKFGGGSVFFDGAQSYLTIPDDDDWNFKANDFTIDFWMKSAASGIAQGFIGQGTPDNPAFELRSDASGILYFTAQTQTQGIAFYYTKNAPAIFDAEWHHIELGREKENIHLVIDGVSQELEPVIPIGTQSMPNGITDVYVGTRFDGTCFFSGWIDELKIRTGAALKNPIFLLSADGEFVDATGRHGVNSYGASIDTVQKVKGSGSAYLNGQGAYLSASDADDWNFQANDFTIDFWMKSTASNVAQAFIGQGTPQNPAFELKSDVNGVISFTAQDAAFYYTRTPQAVFNGAWHHLELVRNADQMYFYVDGAGQELVAGIPIGNKSLPEGTTPVYIGRRFEGGSFFSGWIDELLVKVAQEPTKVNTQEPVTYVKDVKYNEHGQMIKLELGNGVVTTYEYDERTLRLGHMVTTSPWPARDNSQGGQSHTLQDLTYTYDNVGNILTITDAARGSNQTFTYDELNRLKTATGKYFNDGNTSGTKRYVYDEIGNIDTIIDDGVTKDYTYGENGAGPHAVTSITKDGADWLSFTYDLNGNMSTQTDHEKSETTAYAYDTENRLIEVRKGNEPVSQYVYDGDSGRVKKIVFKEKDLQAQGAGVKFTFDKWLIEKERSLTQDERRKATPSSKDSSESPNAEITKYVGSLYEVQGTEKIRSIYFGSQRIATVEADGKVTYLIPDHLGSLNLTLNDRGEVQEWFENDPWGNIVVDEKYGNDDQTVWWYFTGKEKDEETGLIYFGARYYAPSIGRFITPDTIVPYASDPQSLNRYSYARNNPVVLVDPDGHFFWFFAAVAVAGAVWGTTTESGEKFFQDWGGMFGFYGGLINGINGNWNLMQSQAISFGTGFLFGGPVGGMTAMMTTSVLDTKAGRQATEWTANEIFDDMFGVNDPQLAYILGYTTLSIAGNYAFEKAYANLNAEQGTVKDFDPNNPSHREAAKKGGYGYDTFGDGANATNPDKEWAGMITSDLKVIEGTDGRIAIVGARNYGPGALHTGANSPNFPQALNMKNPSTIPFSKGTTFGFCHQAANATLLESGFSNTVAEIFPNYSTYASTFVYGNYGGGLMIKANSVREAYNNWGNGR